MQYGGIIRASIIPGETSTIEVGFPTEGIAENTEAISCRQELQNGQNAIAAAIACALGKELVNDRERQGEYTLSFSSNNLTYQGDSCPAR